MTAEIEARPATDADVVDASIADPAGFATLFDRHATVIRDYLARRVGPQPAEDLTGETFLIAFSRRKDYDLAHQNALPWLYGIASNLVRQRRRAEVRHLRAFARTGVDDVLADHAESVSAKVTAQASTRLLAGALARARATLVHTATSTPVRRHRLPKRIVATATAGAATMAVFPLAPSAGDNAPTASAVTLNDDGTVTIDLTDITDMSAANNMLKGAGIHAELVAIGDKRSCAPGVEPTPPLSQPDGLLLDQPQNERNILTFQPDKIPAGAKLRISGIVAIWSRDMGETMETVPSVVATALLFPENSGTCVDNRPDFYYLVPGAGVPVTERIILASPTTSWRRAGSGCRRCRRRQR